MPAKGILTLLRQSLYILTPGLDAYALYKIKKLRLGLMITVLLPLAYLGVMFLIIDKFPQRILAEFELALTYQIASFVFFGSVLAFWVWLIRRWTKRWNDQFSESTERIEK